MTIDKKYVMAGVLATALTIPMTDAHADETRTITARVNFRTGPGTNYSSMEKIEKGETVTYLSTSGSWKKIKYNSKTGYVHEDYISSSSSTSTRYVNTSVGLNLRKGPSTSYSIITKLADKTEVKVHSTSNGWSKVTVGGNTGYVSSTYLTSTKPSTSTVTTTTRYVNSSSGLNLRTGPSTSNSIITKLADKTEVKVSSTSNGWSKVTVGGNTGYVSSTYLTSTKPSTSTVTTTTRYVNSSSGLNLRTGPSTSNSIITKLADKTEVKVSSTSNGWSKVTASGKTGYVSSGYLTSTKPSTSTGTTSSSASKLISYAKKFLGKPYVWGAQGPNSFDCSGFTYYVYKNGVGKTIPRTSTAQSKYGTYVSKSNLQAGDLVFFDTVGANNGNVTHCGIYIGNGQLLHAASGQGKVVINNMNSSYYVNAYVNARRVL